MKYHVSVTNPSTHYIDIEATLNNPEAEEIYIQLPAWRPGRYELGNFAKNIQKLKVTDEKGNVLPFQKASKDRWKINCGKVLPEGTIRIYYNYYAGQLDGGGCWLDEDQLYFNPIHCCIYNPDRIHEECVLEINSPFKQVATSLKSSGNQWIAADFHELVDSPVIASNSLQHKTYTESNTVFHIWFQGYCTPDWNRILSDFKKFTSEQLQMMKEFPFPEYHFLIQVLPVKFHHGVEHLKSTVLALGPGYKLMEKELYDDFIGVASHELFHSWNIKSIRPVEMMPYDYTKENYTRLGFVAEGVTTYYGDLILLRAGVYNTSQYLTELNKRVQKHFDNYGRFNLSVGDSSFDTWLDGYTPGIPDRKTSIYDEGCLIALMADLLIRKSTGNMKSLDDVMRSLYVDFAMHHHGFGEQDYIHTVEHVAGRSMADFFSNYVFGTADDKPLLSDLLKDIGCILTRSAGNIYESQLGMKVTVENNITKIVALAPGSNAYNAGLSRQDEIMAVNSLKVENNLNELISYCLSTNAEELALHVFSSQKKLKQVKVKTIEKLPAFYTYKIELLKEASVQQKEGFREWAHNEWQ